MCLLFETIKVKDGNFCNLNYHSERMNDAREKLFGLKNKLNLSAVLSVPDDCRAGVFKCRIDYDKDIHKIEFTLYKIRIIKTLQLVYDDTISYSFKFTDRKCFEELKKQSKANEILIVKNGFITDTSFSNIVFFDGSKWLTPDTPLLKGTKRKQLLDSGIIVEKKIMPADLKNFTKIKLINAMLDIEDGNELEIKVS